MDLSSQGDAGLWNNCSLSFTNKKHKIKGLATLFDSKAQHPFLCRKPDDVDELLSIS